MNKQMRGWDGRILFVTGGVALLLWLTAWGLATPEATASNADGDVGDVGGPTPTGAYVAAATPEEAGRYLILAAGCNDCHTPGWMEADGHGIPEEQWLTGVPLGWQGPWGTTYARNLRLTAANLTESEWLERTRAGGLPPMPWANLRAMDERDLVAVYRYIRSLGPTGEPMPAPLAPGVTPTTPWLSMMPVMLGS